jgi:hypothetical protein
LKRKPYLLLLLLTFSALLVHGYHPAAEDGEIYLPGIKKILNPALYPSFNEFFMNHARMSMFAKIVAASVRISHLSFDLTVFVWYFAAVFLTLLAAWEWSGEFFQERESRWAGVALLAALLTLPVAGTSLYISDQYLTPRSLVLFALLFAILNAWRERWTRFVAWSAFAACVHPLMSVFGISYGLILVGMKRFENRTSSLEFRSLAIMAFLPLWPAESDAYRDAVHTRSYFFILQWSWYEWIGIVAPLIIFWLFSRTAKNNRTSAMNLVCRSLVVFGLIYCVGAFVLTVPRPLETLARLQPMRSFHLIYTFLIIIGGGFLAKTLLKKHVWRWALLFVPLSAGMCFAQLETFPTSPHIEWPGRAPTNDWLRAFDWVRKNTPPDAVFAIDPRYMLMDDQHGFRALAERSRLADDVKDSGAVTMFPEPPMAEDWLGQTSDERGWQDFQERDLHRLRTKYGVTWVVLEHPCIGLDCPYQNDSVLVCRVD